MATRSQSQLYLLNKPVTELSSTRLASNGEAFGLFCHLHLTERQPIREASSCVVEKVTAIWDKARVPTCRKDHAITKLEKLHKEWMILKKHKGRTSKLHCAKEEEFRSKMKNLFDIAHAETLTLMKIQEDRDFLLAQREPGRRGYLGSVDKALVEMEARKAQRVVTERKRKEREDQAKASTSGATVESVAAAAVDLESSSESEEETEDKEDTSVFYNVGTLERNEGLGSPPRKKNNKSNRKVITPKLAAALDRTKMSDRKAMFVISETAQSLGHNVNTLSISRSSIKRHREEQRAQMAAALKEEFTGDVPLIVHWDGKLMTDLTGKEHIDRLPVIVTGFDVSQLLKVSRLPDGTGEKQSTAVVEALQEWNVQDRVVGMCFDTTASNTGCHTGACTLIEQKLGNDLLYLACRHHIMELLVGAAFTVSLSPSAAPEVLLFKRFQKQWSFIDKNDYSTSIGVAEMTNILEPVKADIIRFSDTLLLCRNNVVRDDYREFLELAIIFLGGTPPRGIHIMAPGAMHHARWMAKVIYSLKIWMFRSQFKLTKKEEKGLREVCLFSVVLYLKAWFSAPLAVSAPRNDLQLLQDLYKYRQHNDKISKSTRKKLEDHLWYLSEQLVGLAFFDPDVPISTKRKMVNALQGNQRQDRSESPLKGPNRITIKASSASDHSLDDFVTPNTQKFFEKMRISVDFLQSDPETWEGQDEYKLGYATVSKLVVTNDNAERGVALVQELNKLITYDEEQFQFLLQVVSDHRRRYSSCKKSVFQQ